MNELGQMDHQATLLRLLRERKEEYDRTLGSRQGLIEVAEVGVASGRTSELLLKELPFIHLTMVDHWEAPTNHPSREQSRYDQAYETAKARTEFAKDRRTILRKKSVQAAWWLTTDLLECFDLVFIDAHHILESVLTDMVSWWLLVCEGGIFCGHDIDGRKDISGVWGVRKAVEWFTANIVKCSFEVEHNTWIIRKE